MLISRPQHRFPGLSGWAPCAHQCPSKWTGRRERDRWDVRRTQSATAGFADRGRTQVKEHRHPRKLEKAQKQPPQGEPSAAHTSIVVRLLDFALQTCRRTDLCCLKPQQPWDSSPRTHTRTVRPGRALTRWQGPKRTESSRDFVATWRDH